MSAGNPPRFLKMVYLFRIPPWYKMTTLTIYTISGYLIFGQNFKHLSFLISFTAVAVFSAVGFWIFVMWMKNIVVDTDKGFVKIGYISVNLSEIYTIKIGKLSVRFVLRSGDVISFRYPVESVKDLERILRGVNM